MLLAADAGLIELAAKPIVIAATPTGAASFLIFTFTPILRRRCVHRELTPALNLDTQIAASRHESAGLDGLVSLVTPDTVVAITP
jgi:hypothetical protein